MKLFNSDKTLYCGTCPIKYDSVIAVSDIGCYHVVPFWSADDPEVELDAGCKYLFNTHPSN